MAASYTARLKRELHKILDDPKATVKQRLEAMRYLLELKAQSQTKPQGSNKPVTGILGR